jgi:anti-anti-sigma regulatory factor
LNCASSELIAPKTPATGGLMLIWSRVRVAQADPYTCVVFESAWASKERFVTVGHLVVVGDLGLDQRRKFIDATIDVLSRAEGDVELDCSQLDAIDDATLGMLVVLSRAASRRGARLVLTMSSPRVRGDLETAGLSHMFAWPA